MTPAPRRPGCAALALLALLLGHPAQAQTPAAPNAAPALAPTVGLVLDLGYASAPLALDAFERGTRLGGAELSLATPVGRTLEGRIGVALHGQDGALEQHLEEAWIGSTALSAGLQLRAGRMLSQIGYLNEQHPHADDFSTRPLLYRGLLGGHYADDGVRLNWTAPTAMYWRTGVEAFRGRALTPESGRTPQPGAWTLSTKLGDDLGRAHSWQLGLSYLGNRRAGTAPAEHDATAAHDHGAAFAGRHTWLVDGVWKWAPEGNNHQRQLRLAFELAQQRGLGAAAPAGAHTHAGYLAAVYRFQPAWEVGLRTDWLRGHLGDGDAARLREHSLMLAWKPSHQQLLRLNYARPSQTLGVARGHAWLLQYVVSFGTHGAHTY